MEFVVYSDVNLDPEGSAFADEHGVGFVPTTLIFDAEGNEVDRILGGVGEDALRDRIEAAVE